MSVETSQAAPSDEDLVRKAVGGDEAAFRTLFDRHARSVLSVAQKILGDRADAEDVMQEVFMSLYRDLSHFRAEARFATWLYRIVLARAINYRKKRGAYEARLARVASSPASAGASSPNDRIQRALEALPPEYRALAVLRYFRGFSYEEIGEIGGWPLGTVKSKMSRIHEALRNLLGKEPRT